VTVISLFVYGTLKPGRSRWPVLEPYVDPAVEPKRATVEGRLWDTGRGWPALTAGAAVVVGTVVRLRADTINDALSALDAVEGVHNGLFRREIAVTDEQTPCWVYRWPHSTNSFDELDKVW
jgi:gamma-glutamylcyclotransferase (GGCT)/AIG2-like uncharacterized protein YtfP